MIRPGDRLVLESGGGGGWGDPRASATRRATAARDRRERVCADPHLDPPPLAGEGQPGCSDEG